MSIEKVCHIISSKIADELNYNKEQEAVLNYGIFAFLQMLIAIIAVALLGIIFNVLIEALIISFSISILRRSSGGGHASSPRNCAIIGAVVSVVFAVIGKYIKYELYTFTVVLAIIFILSIIIIYKIAPVDSINKPIRTNSKRLRLKKASIGTVCVYIVICIATIFIYKNSGNVDTLRYIYCIAIGLIWQVLSLTKIGHCILEKIDAILI